MKNGWRWAFLGLTAIVVGMELLASFDNDPDTEPWTFLIVDHVPPWVFMTLAGVLAVWLPVHLLYYWRKRKAR